MGNGTPHVVLLTLIWVSFIEQGCSSSSLAAFLGSGSSRSTVSRRTQNDNCIVCLHSSNRRNLSASERERREEELRRQDRSGDVVIGKTSAKDGAQDFGLDIRATEEEWLRQASQVEQEVFLQTQRGMDCLKMYQLEEANEAFNHVFELRPNAYLWQAGIARFYLGDIKGAAEVFSRTASIYESKFGAPASEERLWRDACELKLMNSMSKKERKEVEAQGGPGSIISTIPYSDEAEKLLKSETRKAIRISRELFSATVQKDHNGIILSRAKLRSIGGAFEERPVIDRKMWKINAWYYLGLHYDALGENDESKKCLKMALRMCPNSGKGNDIIHTLPMLHMSCRDWFDDEEFESESPDRQKDEGRFSPKTGSASDAIATAESPTADPVVAESIKSSIASMRHYELQEALQLRGIPAIGSKDDMQEKLFHTLMNDVGLL